jgi:hypothetical protein
VNFTVIAQFAPAATLVLQVFDCAKSSLLVPLIPMLVIVSNAVPVFVSVTTCPALAVPTSRLPKATDVGDNVTAGATPVPVRLTVCGLPAASSVTSSIPARTPTAVGVNLTVMAHVPFAASVAGLTGHVLVCPKSPGFTPLIPMLLIVSGTLPLLVSVTTCPALVVPTP